MTFHLNIVSLKGQIFSGEVQSVSLPAETGRMTVLKDHMPIVSPLTMGEVMVEGDEKINFVIGKGIFTMSENNAELLVEDVMMSEDIIEANVLKKMRKAEETLEKDVEKKDRIQAKYDLEKSKIDLKVIKKSNKKTQSS